MSILKNFFLLFLFFQRCLRGARTLTYNSPNIFKPYYYVRARSSYILEDTDFIWFQKNKHFDPIALSAVPRYFCYVC